MKTAISVDDSLMEQADAAARELGLSRSALIAEALREYMRRRRQAQVSEQLNRAYADQPDTNDRRLVRKLKTKLRPVDRW
jgi:metal-responsive CopG/Arc/MetJ family transcriptional regulator